MNAPVRTTPEAEAQIREIDTWWRANRLAAPTLFLEELETAFDIVSRAPSIGRRYRLSPVRGTRRLLLKGTRYHLYYVSLAEEIRVLAVWHARRGSGPPFNRAGLTCRMNG